MVLGTCLMRALTLLHSGAASEPQLKQVMTLDRDSAYMRMTALFPALHDHLRSSKVGALAIALDVARSKIQGLRVLIDGSCLGPMEMGTQVQTLALVRSLLKRDDISRVVLAVPNGILPAYARDLLLQSKLTICDATDLMFHGAEQVDIFASSFPARSADSLGALASTVQTHCCYLAGSYCLSRRQLS